MDVNLSKIPIKDKGVKSLFLGVLAIEPPAVIETVGVEPTSLSPKDVNLSKIPIKDKG